LQNTKRRKCASDFDSDISAKLDFVCKAGQAIAIYADEREKPMRFWIAEAIRPISKPRNGDDEALFPIYYFASTDEDHLIYKPEHTPRKRVSVSYDQCLGSVATSTHKNNLIILTEMERDRLQAMAVAVDNEEE
tara:strand:- start:328 stop:729 length:402 start_codon:yes stop_codon:yes gene_type:complete